MPKVSVIIPNYSHANFLPKRLESVYNQTYPDFEVILLDDCSKDTSVEELRKYENHPKTKELIINKQNSGTTFKQWIKGLQYADGDFIWFAESDDVAELNFLEEMVKVCSQNPNVGLCYSHSLEINDKDQFLRELHKPNLKNPDSEFEIIPGHTFVKNHLSGHNFIENVSCCLINAKVFEQKESIDPWFKLMGDRCFYIKIASEWDIGFVNKPLNLFRKHGAVVRKKTKINRWWIERMRILTVMQKSGVYNAFESAHMHDTDTMKLFLAWLAPQKEEDKIKFTTVYQGLKQANRSFLKTWLQYQRYIRKSN